MSLTGQISNIYEKIQERLGMGDRNLIGLSIGQSTVKIVELRCFKTKQGIQFDLLKYANHPLSEGTIIEDEIQDEEDLTNAIQTAIEEGQFSTSNVAIGLFGPSVMSKRLRLAGGSPDEIDEQVFWESQQYVTFNLDEAYISYHIVSDDGDDGIDVVVGAAKKKMVNDIKAVVEKTDLKVKVVDLEHIAVVNVFEFLFSEKIQNSNSSFLILNMAGQKIDFIVYSDKSVSFAREIPCGGLTITEEIQRQMGVNYKEAEYLKINKDENGNLPEEVLTIINGVLEKIFTEIEETISFYKTSISDEFFETCYVTGGSIQIPGVFDGLKEILGIDIVQINPFENMGYDESQNSEEDINIMALTCIPAIGLAMRECS